MVDDKMLIGGVVAVLTGLWAWISNILWGKVSALEKEMAKSNEQRAVLMAIVKRIEKQIFSHMAHEEVVITSIQNDVKATNESISEIKIHLASLPRRKSDE